ncbi:uncharacterized protein AB675_994 [Cyphellophora attinorum]|uniref:Uncharacterized protein n=1 Tax=Cyphellophora attinorum TaxID=1664694 RepID=A0A0N0NKL5_9EURO|nr:uncharacterized protein AB675_994 [Phialophora attinorum]KPI38168.1 hypothetical protein AB675_994 [Phialophora attinorum]
MDDLFEVLLEEGATNKKSRQAQHPGRITKGGSKTAAVPARRRVRMPYDHSYATPPSSNKPDAPYGIKLCYQEKRADLTPDTNINLKFIEDGKGAFSISIVATNNARSYDEQPISEVDKVRIKYTLQKLREELSKYSAAMASTTSEGSPPPTAHTTTSPPMTIYDEEDENAMLAIEDAPSTSQLWDQQPVPGTIHRQPLAELKSDAEKQAEIQSAFLYVITALQLRLNAHYRAVRSSTVVEVDDLMGLLTIEDEEAAEEWLVRLMGSLGVGDGKMEDGDGHGEVALKTENEELKEEYEPEL